MSIKNRLIFAISLLLGLMLSQLYISIAITETKTAIIFSIIIAGLAMLILWLHIVKYITSGIRTLQDAIYQVAEGNFASIAKINSHEDEFTNLANSINGMLTSLDTTRRENNMLHEEALQMREEKIALLKHHLSQVVKVQEAERKRVSRELHDQAGQALMAIQLGLGRLEKYAHSQVAKEDIAALKTLAHNTMQDIKNLALDLRPSMLDELGLNPTIRQYAKDFSRRTDIKVELDLSNPGKSETETSLTLSNELETTLFRIIQEGLTNAAKHAQANKVSISLKEINHCLELIIRDNGTGFDVNKALIKQQKECVGLFGMKERVSLWNGDLRITSTPDRGTTLAITIPAQNKSIFLQPTSSLTG